MDELERLLSSLAVLKELTPRTRDFIVSRGERLSARLLTAALGAAGVRARYVDATEVIFTDGPFGGASPNLMLTDLAARKVLRPLCAAGIIPVVPGFIGAAKIDDKTATTGTTARSDNRRALAWRRSVAAAPTSPPPCSDVRFRRRRSRSGRTSLAYSPPIRASCPTPA